MCQALTLNKLDMIRNHPLICLMNYVFVGRSHCDCLVATADAKEDPSPPRHYGATS